MHIHALQAWLSQRLPVVRRAAARPRWAVAELHAGTPINSCSSNPIDLAGYSRKDGRLAAPRAAAIEALLPAGDDPHNPKKWKPSRVSERYVVIQVRYHDRTSIETSRLTDRIYEFAANAGDGATIVAEGVIGDEHDPTATDQA